MCATDAAIADYHRHDISDRVWQRLVPLLPGSPGKVGRPAQNNRRFINAVFWILGAGAPWRDLPPDYGPLEPDQPPFLPLARPGRLGPVAPGAG